MFNSKKKGAYSDLTKEKKLLLKIQNQNLLPKGGGGDQPSLEHRMFLHYFITKEVANVPKYIFMHMIKELKESQENKRCWIPYGRLISEILHQGGVLKVLKELNILTDEQLGTETGKVINGKTLRKMNLIEKGVVKKLSTDLKESHEVSDLMNDFPPICKQDPIEVRLNYILEHYERTGEPIRLSDIPDTMYGGALHVAKSRNTKRKALTEADYLNDAPEQPQKKEAKKANVASKVEATGSGVPNIQQEVQDLHAYKVLNKRTRSGKSVSTSQPSQHTQAIPKKKRKPAFRKLKIAEKEMEDEEQIEAATTLVTREIKNKRATEEASLQKVDLIAREMGVPAEQLLKDSTVKVAQIGIELTENLQQLVVSGELLRDTEEVQMKGVDKVQEENVDCSEAAASEATRGNPDSLHSANIIEIGTMILSRMTITPLPFGNVLPVLHNTTPVLIRLATSTTPSLGTFNESWLAQYGVGKSWEQLGRMSFSCYGPCFTTAL